MAGNGQEGGFRRLPSSQEVQAELDRELGRRRRFMLLRCLVYVLVTLAVVALFVLGVVIPGRVIS